MQMIFPNAEGNAGVIFQGSPEEIFAFQQLLAKAAKNGGEISDLDMIFLNTMIDSAWREDKNRE